MVRAAEENIDYKQKFEEKSAEYEALNEKYSKALRELDWLRRKVFGKMSEKHLPSDPSVLEPSLFDEQLTEEEQKSIDEEIARDEERKAKTITVKGHTREVRTPVLDTSKLEVRETHIYPEGINPDEYDEIGTEVSERIAIEPARMYIERTVRHKMVLKTKLQTEFPEKPVFAVAPLPQTAIYKGMASESLLADIILNKFMYHLPFHRQIQKYKELGVTLSDSTIGDWFAAVCSKLRPIYTAQKQKIMSCDYIQVDESVEPVIDNEKHRTVKGYVWAVRNPLTEETFFHYNEGSRSADTARKLIGKFHGAIQTDGYSVYEAYEGAPGKMMLGCWAHARREFADIVLANDRGLNDARKNELDRAKKTASGALAFIGNLYAVEKEALENKLSPEQTAARRRSESYQTIRRFEMWIESEIVHFNNTSSIYKALRYTYVRLPQLSRYILDGRYKIDNNGVENAIRPIAIGRKNYLFCGNHAAAERAATVYTLISCCKAAGVDPRHWLEDVLTRLETTRPEDLLPSVWKQLHK